MKPIDVLIACDKFKGSLDAAGVCQAIQRGLLKTKPALKTALLPLADGGDGTLAVLQEISGYKEVKCATIDPLGRPITTSYLSKDSTAFIELAAASGIAHLASSELDILNTTTIGTGKLVQNAISTGHKTIVLALGGSCTNDMGTGIAGELGYRFLGADGNELQPSGANLGAIARILGPGFESETTFRILCDVANPLFGPTGAAQVYGPQKGANAAQIAQLDLAMEKLSRFIFQSFGRDISQLSGGGAAGGIAAGLYGLLPSISLESGFEFIARETELATKINQSKLIITGEGRLDESSLKGKVIGGILSLKQQEPVMAFVGSSSISQHPALQAIHQLTSIATMEAAMANPALLLEKLASQVNIQQYLS